MCWALTVHKMNFSIFKAKSFNSTCCYILSMVSVAHLFCYHVLQKIHLNLITTTGSWLRSVTFIPFIHVRSLSTRAHTHRTYNIVSQFSHLSISLLPSFWDNGYQQTDINMNDDDELEVKLTEHTPSKNFRVSQLTFVLSSKHEAHTEKISLVAIIVSCTYCR